MSKIITDDQIRAIARANAIEFAALKAVIEVEASGRGFVGPVPKILYEPHIMYRMLTRKGKTLVRDRLMREHPTLCYPKWGTYKYGTVAAQHDRLAIASKYDRDTALESCSWGMGQVMGFHWKSLGYPSLQAFVNAMYQNEAGQVEAMVKFIATNNLIGALRARNWKAFAKGYNGAGYAANRYDVKLANAYAKYK